MCFVCVTYLSTRAIEISSTYKHATVDSPVVRIMRSMVSDQCSSDLATVNYSSSKTMLLLAEKNTIRSRLTKKQFLK